MTQDTPTHNTQLEQPGDSAAGDTFSTGRGSHSPYAPYLGDHLGVFTAYATAPRDRQHVASGGAVTALLAHAIREGFVDGVAVAKADFSQGKMGYRFDIVTEPDKVQTYGTSAYFNIPLERHSTDIDRFDGSVAVCSLPCHTGIFRKRMANSGTMKNVKLFISLFCGHNNEPELNRFVFQQQGIDESDILDVRVDRSYLGGDVLVTLKDGSIRPIPFRHFNVYRSLWFFSKGLCRYCDDHLGAHADLSIGDVFTAEYRAKDIKHSAIIIRTQEGNRLVESARSKGILTMEPVEESVVFGAQKRVVVPSHDLLSRYYANRLAGFPAKKPPVGRFRIRSFVTYSLLQLNDRLSKTRWGPRLLRLVPRPLLYGYIAVIKLVNNTLGHKL